MKRLWVLLTIAATSLLAGCHEQDTAPPRDLTPPAAPRGVYSVTGDHAVYLNWLGNTEPDLEGYRVFEGPCAAGPDCPYDFVGRTSGTSFAITGLSNGVTRFFAVAAYDHAGNESPLSYETVRDTPRPEGFGQRLSDFVASPRQSGYDFSANAVMAFDSTDADIFFGYNGRVYQMFAAFIDTDIQDAGIAPSLDAVDVAPSAGWSRDGTVELIEQHNYVVWTFDNHYAKFRVVSLNESPARVVFDWAYQVDPGNPQLKAGQPRQESGVRTRRPVVWLR